MHDKSNYLIIEQGNTKLKIAVFSGEKIVKSFITENNDFSWIKVLQEFESITAGIMSSVIEKDCLQVQYFTEKIGRFIWLDDTVKLPIDIEYETKNTLGNYRKAAAVGAFFERQGSNILVIDAGTAITFEVIESSGIYVGGNISPGMTTRFRSLHTYTSKLPLVSAKDEVPFIGTSTEKAIMAGVVNGLIFEIDGYIDALRAKYGDIFVFLTGGDASFFKNRLKNSTFADENLVLKGLKRILEYNVKD